MQFGTASFMDPMIGKKLVVGLETFLKSENINSLDEIRGII